ncbi:hypothetical protein HII13_003972 [Brettanomyces bruxellensis]|uniref:DEBR0S1_20362g1_1 n=1 Tax=Dekkera bruxellensis TaxID=5007 RepID=A0A7D9GXX2_DEKBR|nr:hypothetical protein HII12_004800 [Brettanomyces bruxellensis]KAF6008188.1 hypothetical protein HII13_003972 [Brettanomyces bruxellensis]VUG16580.1 DEBR0S1_20362g1_1 [Brettanomyces bruxellensis]
MVSLTEVKENKPTHEEVDAVLTDAIYNAENAAKSAEDNLKEAEKSTGENSTAPEEQAEEVTNEDTDNLAKAAQEAAEAILKAEIEANDADAAALTKADESDSDSDSDDDDFDDDFDPDETLAERISALKDIFPPQLRSSVVSGADALQSGCKGLAHKFGVSLWYLTTTALLLGAPLALSILHETQLSELEKEMNMQQSSSDILTPGASDKQDEKK